MDTSASGLRHDRSFAFWRWVLIGMAACVVVGLWVTLSQLLEPGVTASETLAPDFLELITRDQGDVAVRLIAEIAAQRGGWGPAPGDTVVFDPYLWHYKRASTHAIDVQPTDCESPDRADRMHPDCGRDFQYQQNLVRFGMYTFVDRGRYGVFEPREVDDMLSVYIEEVGHSWQEYCFETEGRCHGERSRLTTWGDSLMRVVGWEYQVKMYILSLDDNLLNLSQTERDELTSAICEGYANPRFAIIDASAPPGWPAPEGWPMVKPTSQEFEAFCSLI